MSHQIKITVHDDLYQVISDYAENHDCSIAFAALQLTAIGAMTTTGRGVKSVPDTWGGKRDGAGRPKAESDEAQ